MVLLQLPSATLPASFTARLPRDRSEPMRWIEERA